jgi:hypothetical protein
MKEKPMSQKKQFAVVNDDGEIEAIVLIREDEFYCYERLERPPTNIKELMTEYSDCELKEIQIKVAKNTSVKKKGATG